MMLEHLEALCTWVGAAVLLSGGLAVAMILFWCCLEAAFRKLKLTGMVIEAFWNINTRKQEKKKAQRNA